MADKSILYLDLDKIQSESIFDRFYAVCTNLEGEAKDIIKVNQKRWQIEECFRIMKSEFKARPAYLSKEERIKAHFITCFISLVIFRLLEEKLEKNKTEPLNLLKTEMFKSFCSL